MARSSTRAVAVWSPCSATTVASFVIREDCPMHGHEVPFPKDPGFEG
jgi:hypothetical protein